MPINKKSYGIIFPTNIIEEKSKIVIYGYGTCGKNIYEQLKITQYCDVVVFADKTNYSNDSKIEVVKPNMICNYYFDYILISVLHHQEEIVSNLIRYGVDKKKIITLDERYIIDAINVKKNIDMSVIADENYTYKVHCNGYEDTLIEKARIDERINKNSIKNEDNEDKFSLSKKVIFEAILYCYNKENYIMYNKLLKLNMDSQGNYYVPEDIIDASTILNKTYKKNLVTLSKYPYFFCENKMPEEAPKGLWAIDSELFIRYDLRTKAIIGIFYPYKNIEKSNFFGETSEFRYKNLFSFESLKFLNDTVRSTVEMHKDNHIYLIYDDMDEFLLKIQCFLIEPLLKHNKFIFLVNGCNIYNYKEFRLQVNDMIEEEKKAVLSNRKPEPLKIDDIKRVVHFVPNGRSGAYLLHSLFDSNPSILTIPPSGFSNFYSFWINCLRYINNTEKIVESILRRYANVFENSKLNRHLGLEMLEINTRKFKEELTNLLNNLETYDGYDIFKAIFIAYSSAQNNESIESNIYPIIFYHEHYRRNVIQEENLIADGGESVLSDRRFIAQKCEYPLFLFTIREPISNVTSRIRICKEVKVAYELNATLNSVMYNSSRVLETYNNSWGIRFEDLKLNLKESVIEICNILNIPFNKRMLTSTFQGKEYQFVTAGGKKVSTNDKSALNYKDQDELMTEIDKIRMKMLCRRACAKFNYDTFSWDDNDYSWEDIKKIFMQSFKYEEIFKNNPLCLNSAGKEYRNLIFTICIRSIKKDLENDEVTKPIKIIDIYKHRLSER